MSSGNGFEFRFIVRDRVVGGGNSAGVGATGVGLGVSVSADFEELDKLLTQPVVIGVLHDGLALPGARKTHVQDFADFGRGSVVMHTTRQKEREPRRRRGSP